MAISLAPWQIRLGVRSKIARFNAKLTDYTLLWCDCISFAVLHIASINTDTNANKPKRKALQGPHVKAQGAALGKPKTSMPSSERARYQFHQMMSPFQGLRCFIRIRTPGLRPGLSHHAHSAHT